MDKEIDTDGELLNRYVHRGEDAAFEELVRRHAPMVLRLCRRITASTHDAEDAAQKVFAVLAGRARELHSLRSLAGWLYSTAWNIASQDRRADARRRRRELLAAQAHASVRPVEARVDDALFEFYRALEMLPEGVRTAIVLHHLEGMRIAELAELTGEPIGTVASRLSRGREMIRERLSRRGLPCSAAGLGALLDGELELVDPRTLSRIAHATATRAGEACKLASVGDAQMCSAATATPAVTAASCCSVPAPVAPGAAGAFLGLLQGRAAVLGALAVLVGAGSAPGRQFIGSAADWVREAIRSEVPPPSAGDIPLPAPAPERSRGTSGSGSRSGSGGSYNSIPEPSAGATIGAVGAWAALRRRSRDQRPLR